MIRVKAVIAYNGSRFQGFQRQKSTSNTISSTLEIALKSLGIQSRITGSGRTDAGVHASGQVIHLDIPDFWGDLKKLKEHLNGKLKSIEIKHIVEVSDTFHARFCAKRRIYRYIFKASKPTVFEEEFVAHITIKSYTRLEEALACFVGEHDFSYFIKSGSITKDNIRRVYRAYYKRRGDYHYIYFEANGFLRAQVRMMIQTATEVANNHLSTAELKEQLNLVAIHNRRLAAPQGLYLARVIYHHNNA